MKHQPTELKFPRDVALGLLREADKRRWPLRATRFVITGDLQTAAYGVPVFAGQLSPDNFTLVLINVDTEETIRYRKGFLYEKVQK